MSSDRRMPVVFFGHGSPTNVIEDNEATRTWQQMGASLPIPKAILCISAHWCTRGTAVTAMDTPRTIHDFGRSLPAPLFDCQYPAPGSPALAQRVAELLQGLPATLDHGWGLDHGTWSVLSKAWPDANIPVVQLSIDVGMTDQGRIEVGRKLLPLRDDGVMIVGSGNIVHNLGIMQWDDQAEPFDWAIRFNEAIKAAIDNGDDEAICNHQDFGDDARLAVPTPDHFWPLLYVLGARDGDPATYLSDTIVFKSLSMTSIIFDGKPGA